MISCFFKNKLALFALLVLVLAPCLVLAEPGNEPIKLIVPIGGTESVVQPGEYISKVYIWSIGIAALLAMLMLVVGGIQYTLSAGSVFTREEAMGRMKNAVFGLIILILIF